MQEITQDIFRLDRTKYALAHCISANCAFGDGKTGSYGIAAAFKQHFPGIKEFCLQCNPKVGDAILYTSNNGWVYNLVTKKMHWQKPTYEAVEEVLNSMRVNAMQNLVKGIAMPRIACGLDRLSWDIVKGLIVNEFKHTGIEILVCNLK